MPFSIHVMGGGGNKKREYLPDFFFFQHRGARVENPTVVLYYMVEERLSSPEITYRLRLIICGVVRPSASLFL